MPSSSHNKNDYIINYNFLYVISRNIFFILDRLASGAHHNRFLSNIILQSLLKLLERAFCPKNGRIWNTFTQLMVLLFENYRFKHASLCVPFAEKLHLYTSWVALLYASIFNIMKTCSLTLVDTWCSYRQTQTKARSLFVHQNKSISIVLNFILFLFQLPTNSINIHTGYIERWVSSVVSSAQQSIFCNTYSAQLHLNLDGQVEIHI